MEIVKNSKITIRAFKRSDAEEFRVACLESLDTVGIWMPWCHSDYSLQEAYTWIQQCQENIADNSAYDLGVFDTSKSRLLGSIAINQIDQQNKCGSIGYWIRRSAHRQGVALQAVRLIVDYCFRQLGLVRLELVIHKNNGASRKLAEKAGAVYEGIARDRLILIEKPEDACIYSFIQSDIKN